MPALLTSQTIRIGLVAGEPIRLEGLAMIFEEKPVPGQTHLVPVIGTIQELLANPGVEYLVVDLNRQLKTHGSDKKSRTACVN